MSAVWEHSTSSKHRTLQKSLLAKSHCDLGLSWEIFEHSQFDKLFKKKKNPPTRTGTTQTELHHTQVYFFMLLHITKRRQL